MSANHPLAANLTEARRVQCGNFSTSLWRWHVGQEMLQQRRSLPILRIVPLQAVDECDGHRTVEERVFPVHLFAAAPARIALQIGLRSPEHQNLAIVLCGLRNESRLIALDARSLANQLRIHDSPMPGVAPTSKISRDVRHVYLSLWYPNLRLEALPDKLTAVLGAFAAHGGEEKVYSATVWPVSWNEAPVFQRIWGWTGEGSERGADPRQAVEETLELFHDDCAYEFQIG